MKWRLLNALFVTFIMWVLSAPRAAALTVSCAATFNGYCLDIETTGWPNSRIGTIDFLSTGSAGLPYANVETVNNGLTIWDQNGNFGTFLSNGAGSDSGAECAAILTRTMSPAMGCDSNGQEPAAYPSRFNGSPIVDCANAPGGGCGTTDPAYALGNPGNPAGVLVDGALLLAATKALLRLQP